MGNQGCKVARQVAFSASVRPKSGAESLTGDGQLGLLGFRPVPGVLILVLRARLEEGEVRGQETRCPRGLLGGKAAEEAQAQRQGSASASASASPRSWPAAFAARAGRRLQLRLQAQEVGDGEALGAQTASPGRAPQARLLVATGAAGRQRVSLGFALREVLAARHAAATAAGWEGGRGSRAGALYPALIGAWIQSEGKYGERRRRGVGWGRARGAATGSQSRIINCHLLARNPITLFSPPRPSCWPGQISLRVGAARSQGPLGFHWGGGGGRSASSPSLRRCGKAGRARSRPQRGKRRGYQCQWLPRDTGLLAALDRFTRLNRFLSGSFLHKEQHISAPEK